MITGRSPGYIAGTSDVYLWLMPEYTPDSGVQAVRVREVLWLISTLKDFPRI